MKKYNFKFPDSWVKFKVPLSSIILFKIFSLARKINQNYFKKTTEKIGLKRHYLWRHAKRTPKRLVKVFSVKN